MNHFDNKDIVRIQSEAHDGIGNYLACTSWDFIYRAVEIKLTQKKIPFSKSEVDDLRNVVFIKLIENDYQRIIIFDAEKSKFETWLFLIVNNVIVDELNNKNGLLSHIVKPKYNEYHEDLVQDLINEDVIIKKLNNQQLIKLINKYLDKLNPRYNLAIKLIYFDKKSRKKAAKIMCVSIKHFDVILSRARNRLIEILNNHEPELFTTELL